MRKTLLLLAMFIAFSSAQGFAADLVASTTLPADGTPEHVFTIKSANGNHMNGQTCPTMTYEKYGKFAFYAVKDKIDAYYIYSTTEKKWITYATADEYQSGKAFVTLGTEKDDACYFFASKTDDGAYDFAPATAGGDKSGQFLNWFGGVNASQTPMDGTVTVGLWKQPGREDSGSKWELTPEADEPNPNPVEGDYKVNFGKGIDPVRTDRKVTGFSVTGTETETQTIAIESNKPYVNLMEDSKAVITCKRSEPLTVKFSFQGTWVNGYVYVDTNKVNFGKGIDPVRTDRKVTGFSVTGTETETQTIAIESNKPYVNLMEDSKAVITCKRSEPLTVKFSFQGTWVNGYVYVDTNKDKQFSFKEGQTDQTGTELYSFSFYSGNVNDDSQGMNSKGESLTGNARNVLNPPTFNAPAEPGDYAIRLKVDWNSVDPGGQIGEGGTCFGRNGILSNGGKIIDAILRVKNETLGVTEVSRDNHCPVEYYDLSGRRLNGEPTHGVFIRKGAKTMKVVK